MAGRQEPGTLTAGLVQGGNEGGRQGETVRHALNSASSGHLLRARPPRAPCWPDELALIGTDIACISEKGKLPAKG